MKKIIALTLLVFFLYGPSAFAHTGLESSTPAEGEVVTEELQEMVLAFNTELEKASSFTVKDAEGMEIPLGVSVENDTMVGTLGAAMADGEYTVNWNIIGADGHPIEGSYAFTLKTGAETAVPDVPKETEAPVETVQEVQAQPEEEAGSSYTLVLVLMVLIVVAAGTLIWTAKRRAN